MSELPKTFVLIVDDVPETRENIRKLLQFEADIEVVGGAATGKEAIDMAKKLRPNVIMMDINMPDMDGITATEQINRAVPSAQVIMLSVQNDADYMRRAMMAGARDFLAKPPAGDELIATIRRVAEMSRQQEALLAAAPVVPGTGRLGGILPGRRGDVITVYSPKGGAGCTTVATNLAVVLHSDEEPVVIVDADLQFGDVGVFLNVQSKHTLVDVAETADDLDLELLDTVLTKHSSGTSVLLAPFSPEAAEVVSGEAVREIIRQLRHNFAYVIVDTASTLNDVVLSVFDVSDLIVLIVTPDIPSIKNARLFFDLADALEYPPEQTLMVLNRVDRKGGISAQDIKDSIKHDVVAEIPIEPRLIVHSINQGTPIVQYPKPTPPGRALHALGKKIVGVLQAEQAAIE